MSGLPMGWVGASIRDAVCEFETVDPKRTPDKLFRYVDIGAIDNSVQRITAPKEFLGAEAPSRARRVIKTDDVLFSTVRTYLRNVAQVQEELDGELTSTGISVLRANEAADPGYLFRWVSSSAFIDEISQSQDGTLYPAVKDEDVMGGPIPLPPLPEQRRIVRKLDTLSARTTTARTHLTTIAKLVERYRAAVLEAAFKTAWDAGGNATVAGCLEHAETGLVRSKAEQTVDEGYPYIRMNHYDLAGRWNDRDLTYVAASSSEFSRYQLKANDLLFNTRNSAELVGKVAIWPEGKQGYLFNNNLLRMRFGEEVVPAFAFWQMSSPPFRRYIGGFISATTSVAAIYQRSLMAAPFWAPDTDEQHEIVHRIETAFAKIDRLAAEAAQALKLTDRLDQRILAKAFAGELVPQDPTDEPATELLARIREARATAPKPKRGRRKKVAT